MNGKADIAAGPGTATARREVLAIDRLTIALPPGGDRPHAVEDVSLSVGAGEIVCVVGESGSGKSVTAFSVMGLGAKELRPAAGSIRLEGEELIGAGEARLRQLRGDRMAMIFQEPMTALDPVRTIGDQIGEALRAHTRAGAAERRRRTLEMIEAVRLPDPERIFAAWPHQLSGGQRQRAMIAGALILDPALLIADEPTTALDVTTQAQILKLIAQLRERRGAGVLFITHDFGVVAEIAHRVAVMQKGRIVEQGLARDVLTNPRHPYTQMLIDAAPSMRTPARAPLDDAPTVFRATRLGKVYGAGGWFGKKRETVAARDVSLDIRRGETLGIVGESGSGKSTVARCAARLIDPDAGELFLGNAEYSRLGQRAMRPLRKRIQIVFQDPYRSLNPRRTIGQSLIEAPLNFGARPAQAREQAGRLLEFVGLTPSAMDRFPHQFSGGQRQRVCIARALMVEPELLIADEAVSALDVSVQAQVLKLLDEARARFNLALMFITHDLRVAAQICDRIAVMRQGEIVEQGRTAEIFAQPRHEYTKALFAAAPGYDFQAARESR